MTSTARRAAERVRLRVLPQATGSTRASSRAHADQILAAAPNFSLLRLVVVLPASQVLRRRVELPLVQERQLLPAVAGHDLALEFDSPSSFGWLAVHLVTESAPTHIIVCPVLAM